MQKVSGKATDKQWGNSGNAVDRQWKQAVEMQWGNSREAVGNCTCSSWAFAASTTYLRWSPDDLAKIVPAPAARVMSFCCARSLPLVGASIRMEIERQQNDSLADG